MPHLAPAEASDESPPPSNKAASDDILGKLGAIQEAFNQASSIQDGYEVLALMLPSVRSALHELVAAVKQQSEQDEHAMRLREELNAVRYKRKKLEQENEQLKGEVQSARRYCSQMESRVAALVKGNSTGSDLRGTHDVTD